MRSAWFEDRRVTVVDVEDPLSAPRSCCSRIKFLGHSDKRVSEGIPPILLALEIREGSALPERSESHVGTEDPLTGCRWHDCRFTILENAYNAMMRASIERLDVEPLALTRE